MSESVPREPGFYFPSIHSIQQVKHRGISWEQVATTLQDGRLKTTHKDNCWLFIRKFPGHDLPVGVVADTDEGEVITVEWRRGESG